VLSRASVACELPSKLAGVPFSARGTVRFKASVQLRRNDRAAVRASALSALDALAVGITSKHKPSRSHAAQVELAAELSDWLAVKDHGDVLIRGAIRLELAPEAARRSQAYEDAIRTQQLEQAIQEERRRDLQQTLKNLQTARAWWLDRHQHDLQSFNWNGLENEILPYLGKPDDPDAWMRKIADVFGEVMSRLKDDEAARSHFVQNARFVIEQMGWTDTARALPQRNDGERVHRRAAPADDR
jgi:hypothetical protein